MASPDYVFRDLKISVHDNTAETTSGESAELEISNGDQVLFICEFVAKLADTEAVFPLDTNGAPISLRFSITESRTKSATQLSIATAYNAGHHAAYENLSIGRVTCLMTLDPTGGLDSFLGTLDQRNAHFEIQWEDNAGIVSTLYEAPILIKQQGDSTPNPAPTPAANYLLSTEIETNLEAEAKPLRINTLDAYLRSIVNANFAMHEGYNLFADEFANETDTDAANTTAIYDASSDSYSIQQESEEEFLTVSADGTEHLGHKFSSGTYVDQWAQGFQLTTGRTISNVKFTIGVVAGTPGNIEVRIETDSAGNPSGTLADANLTNSLSSGYVAAEHNITFATPAALLSATQYHLVLKLASDPGDGNSLRISGDASNNYASGISAYRTSSTWGASSGILDAAFKIQFTRATAQVQSDAHTASPSTGRAYLVVWEDVGTGTIVYEISRDGGTTWSTVTMALLGIAGSEINGLSRYWGDVDLSGQPAGTSIKVRATVTGNAELHGWSADYNG